MTLDTLWVPCRIENSGFSSERRFEVDLSSGDGKAVGTAYIEYLQNAMHQPIEEGWPGYGEIARGFVQCRVVKRDRGTIWVEFPGTDVFHVQEGSLAEM